MCLRLLFIYANRYIYSFGECYIGLIEMQEYKLKRGYKPEMDRIYECLTESFPSEIKEEDGKYVTSYGVLSSIKVWIEGKKLAVDTESDTSMTDDELILDSNKRFRDFLYAATGYTAKERLKQAKKEVSK
jgi:hypothetical protein